MEPNFQTSFIPKKSAIEQREDLPRTFGLFTIVAVIFFLSMVVSCAGLYFYKGIMANNLVKMAADLELAKNRFEPSKIVQLQVLDKRLRAATEVLDKHVALSPIFQALQEVTMKTVRFTKFSYRLSMSPTPKVEVTMNGTAVGYRSVALQADLFSERKYFIDPIFSNLTLDEKGNVLFTLEFSVEPSFVDYKQMVEAGSSAVVPVTPTTGVTN